MAKGKKTGGRNFKPGVSGNPAGRRPLPPEIKAARAMNQLELERILNHVVFLPMPEIIALTKCKESPAFVVGAAKIVEKFAKHGNIWAYNAILDRLIGRVREAEPREIPPPARDVSPPAKKTFTEFCVAAGYPPPFAKQIEMVEFGLALTEPRLLLGSRGYGKTDYITILGVAYDLYMNAAHTWMVLTKERKRSAAIIDEIAKALEANGVELEKSNSNCIRVKGLQGKDHSVDARSIRSGLRGPHPYGIIMDDPVTEEDVSEATRQLVERKYNESFKLTSNILIIGQPAHQFDLYAKLRPLLKKMELPHGTIPELDHDLEAQRLAGVSEASISASYHLKILAEGSLAFANIKYIDEMPHGDSVAFIDPSEGGDFTAVSAIKAYFDGVAVEGQAWKRAWYHCLDDLVPFLLAKGVRRVCFETNKFGNQPVSQLQELLAPHGIGVVGKNSSSDKHGTIMNAGSYSHMIHLSRASSKPYTDQVVQYEYGAKFDDGPDSLARGLEWLGLIRGKT